TVYPAVASGGKEAESLGLGREAIIAQLSERLHQAGIATVEEGQNSDASLFAWVIVKKDPRNKILEYGVILSIGQSVLLERDPTIKLTMETWNKRDQQYVNVKDNHKVRDAFNKL